jgi:2-polyprenyl-3-methyl-5-hydroxy-6-metoxy-1,4-benzoquinol methylase
MKQDSSTHYKYACTTPKSEHHHSYIAKPILDLISSIDSNQDLPPREKSNLRVLDLGCGNENFTNFLASQKLQVMRIEESASGVELAQKAYSSCQFINGSTYNLELAELEHSFDIIISAEVIEYLFFHGELPRAAKKLLRPGSHLITTTPYHGYFKNLALSLSNKMDNHFTALWDGKRIKFFSVKTLSQLLISEDFVNLQLKFAGRISYLWKTMIYISKSIDSHACN